MGGRGVERILQCAADRWRQCRSCGEPNECASGQGHERLEFLGVFDITGLWPSALFIIG